MSRNWEICPRCGGDHVTVFVVDEREVDATVDLMVSVAREDARRSVLPAVSLRIELIDLECLDCDHRWRG